MGRKVVGVFGWYGQKNIGDEAFCDSFRFLFPEYDFKFFNRIPSNLTEFDALMVGGGSFLDQKIPGLPDVQIPIAFVGVGITDVHPYNQPALDRAKIVVTRNHREPYLKASDLVFGQVAPPRQNPDRITIFLNNHFSPTHKSLEWQLRSWDWFSVEFAQACDRLVEKYNCNLHFLPMCTNPTIDDRRAASYVVDRMRHKQRIRNCLQAPTRDQIMDSISHSHLVISQRFHSLVFSILSGVPFVALNGHSKVEDLVSELGYGGIVDYYGFSMPKLWRAMEASTDIGKFHGYVESARTEWQDMSVRIKAALFG